MPELMKVAPTTMHPSLRLDSSMFRLMHTHTHLGKVLLYTLLGVRQLVNLRVLLLQLSGSLMLRWSWTHKRLQLLCR